jgi:hypothetical protein
MNQAETVAVAKMHPYVRKAIETGIHWPKKPLNMKAGKQGPMTKGTFKNRAPSYKSPMAAFNRRRKS